MSALAQRITGSTGGRISAGRNDDEVQDACENGASWLLIRCLVAMLFACAVLGVLGRNAGAMKSVCPASDTYSLCGVIQDIRSLLSFAFGAIFCSILSRQEDGRTTVGNCKGLLFGALDPL